MCTNMCVQIQKIWSLIPPHKIFSFDSSMVYFECERSNVQLMASSYQRCIKMEPVDSLDWQSAIKEHIAVSYVLGGQFHQEWGVFRACFSKDLEQISAN